MLRLGALEVAALDGLAADALVAFVGRDERPLSGLAGLVDWRLAGGLTRLIETGALSGEADEAVLSVTTGRLSAGKLFAFGLGRSPTAEAFDEAARRAARAVRNAGAGRIAIGLPEAPRAAHSARSLAAAFAGHPHEVVVLGELQELALLLPEAARRS